MSFSRESIAKAKGEAPAAPIEILTKSMKDYITRHAPKLVDQAHGQKFISGCTVKETAGEVRFQFSSNTRLGLFLEYGGGEMIEGVMGKDKRAKVAVNYEFVDWNNPPSCNVKKQQIRAYYDSNAIVSPCDCNCFDCVLDKKYGEKK